MNEKQRKQWLAQRRTGIGGSDAAAVLGLSRFSSPYSVWADKLARVPEQEDNEAMRQGRDLEDYVAQRFMQESGKRVQRKSEMLRHPEQPFMLANIDRRVVGERAGLECKTTKSMNIKRFRSGDFPAEYYCQCMHYLAVTGWERWYLAVLVYGEGFFIYIIEWDEAEIAALIDTEREFWSCVESQTPPPVDGHTATTETMHKLFSPDEYDGEEVDLFGMGNVLSQLERVTAEMQAKATEKEQLEQTIKSAIGSGCGGSCGDWRVSWKPQGRKNFNVKAFAADHPEIDLSNYYATSVFRVLRVKKESVPNG
jgi:putative phage-type endonuclease